MTNITLGNPIDSGVIQFTADNAHFDPKKSPSSVYLPSLNCASYPWDQKHQDANKFHGYGSNGNFPTTANPVSVPF